MKKINLVHLIVVGILIYLVILRFMNKLTFEDECLTLICIGLILLDDINRNLRQILNKLELKNEHPPTTPRLSGTAKK
jgi:hypothetical protein